MTVKRSKDQRSFPPTFGNQRLRATFKPTRVGGPTSMPTKRRIPDSRRATARNQLVFGADKRQRVEARTVKSFMRRIFSRRKV